MRAFTSGGIWRERLIHKRTRTDNRHVAEEDIEKLRQFIDFRLAQKTAKRKNSRIAMRRMQTSRHVRRIQEHRRELPDFEVSVIPPDTRLSVENIMFTCAFECDHNRNQKRRQYQNRNARKDDVEKPFKKRIYLHA